MGTKKKRRTFTPEFKAEVVEQVRTDGKKVAEVAREHGLSVSSVRAWVRQAELDRGHDAPPDTRSVLEELRALAPTIDVRPAAVVASMKEEACEPAFAPTVPVVPLVSRVPPVSLPPMPAVVEAPAHPSAFRLIEARALTPRMPAKRPPPAVAQAPATPRRFALLAGAAAPLLVVGLLFLARPAEGGAEAATAPTPAVPSAVASAETHYVAQITPAPIRARSPAAAPEPAPAASTPPTTPATTVGTVVTTTPSHDHRIFVDGRTVGVTGETIEVRCGHHRARYGSEGRLQDIDVPCGGQVTLEPSWGGAVRDAGSSTPGSTTPLIDEACCGGQETAGVIIPLGELTP